jgi:hypothetical protein
MKALGQIKTQIEAQFERVNRNGEISPLSDQ